VIVSQLNNGLRFVAERSAGPVSYIGLAVDAGSRDDPANHPGLAHFLEHTIFKGTRRRKAWHISNRMESIGGELNAYTTKELTMVYTIAPSGYTDRALELLADLVMNASFPRVETERERDIVIEEINSYHDSPSDAVFDEFDELIYAGSGMAHNILGDIDSVRHLDGTMARRFLDTFYTPGNIVVYCVDSDPDRAARLIERRFGDLEFPTVPHSRVTPPMAAPFEETRDRDNSQANTIVGCRIPGRKDPRSYAMMLFNNILGGPALNSLLCQQIRERRGLVYTIESNAVMLSDCGTFTVYFGSDPSTTTKCCRLIRREIDRLAQNTLSERTFNRMRDQYCGQLDVLSDNRENCAMSLGRSLLLNGEIHTLRHTAEHIRMVTPDLLRDVAQTVASQQLSRLTLT